MKSGLMETRISIRRFSGFLIFAIAGNKCFVLLKKIGHLILQHSSIGINFEFSNAVKDFQCLIFHLYL